MSAPPDLDALLHTLPMVAVWADSWGLTSQPPSPSLRVAIWDDGRVLFATNVGELESTLRYGQISRAVTEQLARDIAMTGLFDLKGHCYLVPDAPVLCLLATLEEHEQLLYWDEVEVSNYGINIDPKPHHHDFMKTWKSVGDLTVAAIPSKSVPIDGAFCAPKSWYVKEAIQSE